MAMIITSLMAELLKVRKSKIFVMTFLGFSIAPLMGGFFMFILKDPEFARTSGLLGSKAALHGTADWPSLWGMLAQIVAIGGIVLFGFIASWVFGREYADRTVKDLLALPVPRISVVLSKFIAIVLWCACLTFYVLVLGFLVGWLVGLPQWSMQTAIHGIGQLLAAAVLTTALSSPVAFFASYGRGYLPPMGFVILAVILAQIVGAVGYGAYFPWAVPALFTGAAGPENAHLGLASFAIVALTSLTGLIATMLWWRLADQN